MGTIVGYANKQKGYRVSNSRQNRLETVRYVIFSNPKKVRIPITNVDKHGDEEEFF